MEPRAEVYCLKLNMIISKLGYSIDLVLIFGRP